MGELMEFDRAAVLAGIDQQVLKDKACWPFLHKLESELLMQAYELGALMADIRFLCLTDEEIGP